MTKRENTPTGKTKVRRLALKRETIKDLDVKNTDKYIKGGLATSPEPDCGCQRPK